MPPAGRRRTRIGSGTSRASSVCRSAKGRSRRSWPSTDSASKKTGETGVSRAAVSTSTREPTRPAVSWNERGRPAVVEGDHLTVEDEPLASQRPRGRGQFGQPVGDVVEGAGVEPYVVTVAVHLDPDAVQFLLDHAGPELLDGLRHRGGAVREHRQDGAADGEPEAGEGRGSVGQQGLRDGLDRAREHHRAPYVRGRCVGGGRQALHGHGVQGALPYLTRDQREQEPLLVRRWPLPATRPPAACVRPASRLR